MHSLINNLQYVNSNTPVAVTSFVYLDSDYQETDVLGVQLGEAFQHEVHKLGIPVVDFKAMDYIRVTPQGDMVLSKDFLDLNTEVPIRYVLSGTLVAHRNGTIVNARIIGMQSKAVVASAQGFIPLSISKDLVSSRFVDGLPLK
jgi:TolB-like protein